MRVFPLLLGALALVACGGEVVEAGVGGADGAPDLAVAGDDTVNVPLDEGGRTFAALADYPPGMEPLWIAAEPIENVYIIEGDGTPSVELTRVGAP